MGCLDSIFQVWSDKGFEVEEKNTGGKGRKFIHRENSQKTTKITKGESLEGHAHCKHAYLQQQTEEPKRLVSLRLTKCQLLTANSAAYLA